MEQSSKRFLDRQFSKAELEAIEEHKYFLSEKAGYDVGRERAIADWLANYAASWREQRLTRELAEQKAEIGKHKWIESEKAGRDLGREAVRDWIIRFAAGWREWHEKKQQDE